MASDMAIRRCGWSIAVWLCGCSVTDAASPATESSSGPTTSSTGSSGSPSASTSSDGAPTSSTSSSSGADSSTSHADTSSGSSEGGSSTTGASMQDIDGFDEWTPTCLGPTGQNQCQSAGLPDDDLCDPYAQDCGPGSKCGFNDNPNPNGLRLRTECLAVGTKTVGEPCSYTLGLYEGADECDADGWCNNVDPATGVGVCVGYCDCGLPCPGGSGMICDGDGFATNAPFCTARCNPLLGDDACPQGWHCQPVPTSQSQGWAGLYLCLADYMSPPCPNGWTTNESNVCQQLCSTDGVYPCDDGAPCTAFEHFTTPCPPLLGLCPPP